MPTLPGHWQEIAVHGAALQDAHFGAARDRVRHTVGIGASSRRYRIEAELRHQTISLRWTSHLGPYETAEPQRFVRY